MECSRRNCENIMCDTYIPGDIGYICNKCQNEFKEYFNKQNIPLTELSLYSSLKKFMETPKSFFENKEIENIDEFFSSHTRD